MKIKISWKQIPPANHFSKVYEAKDICDHNVIHWGIMASHCNLPLSSHLITLQSRNAAVPFCKFNDPHILKGIFFHIFLFTSFVLCFVSVKIEHYTVIREIMFFLFFFFFFWSFKTYIHSNEASRFVQLWDELHFASLSSPSCLGLLPSPSSWY